MTFHEKMNQIGHIFVPCVIFTDIFFLKGVLNANFPSTYTMSIAINTIEIFICLIFLYFLYIDQYEKKSISHYFIFMLIAEIALLTFDTFSCFFSVFKLYNLHFRISSMIYIVINTMVYLLWKLAISITQDHNAQRFDKLQTMILMISIINIFMNLFFKHLFFIDSLMHYQTNISFVLSVLFPVMMNIILMTYLFTCKASREIKIRLILYSLLPLICACFSWQDNHSFLYFGCLGTIVMIYSTIYLNIRKEMEKNHQLVLETENQIEKYKRMIMLSQIQPHFIYNVLGSISMLYRIDSEKAAEATENFAKYLRANIDTMNEHDQITFHKELEHIKNYLYLEQMRFGDIEIQLDEIENDDFIVPALSIQPLVENAIKHGLMGLDEGGKIIIQEIETKDNHIIIIEDNGVGYTPKTDDSTHTGINNARYRLKELVNGQLEIESTIHQGTKVTITIPKIK